MFRRRRQRREFHEVIGREVERVGPPVQAAVEAVAQDVASTAGLLRELPGAAAECPSCGGRMRMRRIKEGRRWWTLWACSRCGKKVRPAELPTHHRFGGWRG
jgi:predicted RNA-binding Zn-ribbon protein involved in translation (DUF1610 family)